MRALRVITLLAALLTLALVGFGFSIVRHGFSAHDRPTLVETWVARTVRSLAVPSRAKRLNNPLTNSQENIAAGMGHWADHCAQCHANNGTGNTEIGNNLYPKVPDMRLRATQQMSDGELYYTIQNGIRLSGMPAWGSQDDNNSEDSWKLVLFIRHLPELRPEEERQMETLNPLTPEELQEKQEERQFLNEESTTKPAKRSQRNPHH